MCCHEVRTRLEARSFAHQQQTKGKRLGESRREQSIEIAGAVTARLRVSVQHVPKFLAHLYERMVAVLIAAKLSQAIAHDPADKPGGMRHQFRKMQRITRAWLLSGSITQALDQTQQRCRIMLCNRLVGERVVAIGTEAAVRDNSGAVEFFVAVEQPKLGEIARRPAGKLLEPLELARVCSTPAGRVSRFRGRLELHKSARWCTCPLQCDIRPPDPRIKKLRRDRQPLRDGQQRNQPFKQLLEGRGERRFRNVRVRAAKLPNSARVGLQKRGDAHCTLLTCGLLGVIMRRDPTKDHFRNPKPTSEFRLATRSRNSNRDTIPRRQSCPRRHSTFISPR